MARNSLTWRQWLRPYAQLFGVRSSACLWHGVALAAYRRKRKQDHGYREWLSGSGARWINNHWGTSTIEDELTREHTAAQLYALVGLLQTRFDPISDRSIVLDAGASDGSFLSLLGIHRGVAVNFLQVCSRKILADGYPSVLADIEQLPFPDRAFEHVICCETLEHVPNPIATLNELGRVCRGRIYLSIPWVPYTRITGRPAGWPSVESHIFEFSETDFRKIITYSRLAITYSGTVQVFPEPCNPLSRWWLEQWMYSSYFPRLQYYELSPVSGIN